MERASSRLAGERGRLGIPFFKAWAGLGMAALLLLVIWNWTDPLPPAWDEAQHLLQAQAFGLHLGRFRWEKIWWQQLLHLNQRYPPLAYWLGIPLAALHPFGRADGQLLNWVLLGVLILATQRLGRRVYRSWEVGWLAAALVLLYPGITALAHVYMLELPLVVAVTLAFCALWAYAEEPSWRGAAGVGAGVAAVLLTKWTGVLFLLLPLVGAAGQAFWRSRKAVGWQKGIPVAQMGLGLAVTLLLCWPWYGANWLFVLSNGWGYASTAHYYVTCGAGSLCWWTAYLRWLPLQMSPFLCPLPLLTLLGSLDRREAVLWAAYSSGYLLYTVVDIKDVRFTLPLLPLLAVLSAGGMQKAYRWLGERWGGWALQRGACAGLVLGCLALASLGRPLTPGVAPLWRGIPMQWQGQRPAQELTQWIETLLQPGLTTTLGVLPNTELISSETLTYLAALQRWPVTFRAAGQTPWPELELSLLDGFVDAAGEQGIVGPYGPAKEQIRQHLRSSPDWRQEPGVELPSVGRLQTYFPRRPRVTVQESPLEAGEVELVEVEALSELGIPAWRLRWQGPAQELAQTLAWAWLEDSQGQVLAERAWVVGQNRLQLSSTGVWLVEEILTLPTADFSKGSFLHLDWQLPNGIRHALHQPWRGFLFSFQKEGSLFLMDPLFPLQEAARAAAAGDLQTLSLYLNAWTTLQYPTFLTDPDRTLTRQLLEGQWQQAAAQGRVNRQIQSHYQLGLMLAVLLQPQAAQRHFQQIVELDPEDQWARAYLAFLRVFFTRDLEGVPELQQEVSAMVRPLCQKADPDWDWNWVCADL
ncbi:phospholipid carrier-dependent glycosyltransferase [Synechococcus sp. H55.9]|uniref:phospholipid carrier-dependent glycosyltransferase n=1 Tax=Synechococcus sp. H55.9 TaxID=2964511 RepID=UPI0039C4E19D